MGYGTAVYGQSGYGTSSTGLAAYPKLVLSDGPHAYYRLDETSGTVLTDSSPNGLHGSIGGVTIGVPGVIPDGTAFLLSGESSTVATFTAADAGTPFTIEAWVRCTTPGAGPRVVAGDMAFAGASQYAALMLDDGVPRFHTRNTDYTPYDAAGSVSVADDRPHHLVGTWDGTTTRLYVDGVLAASTATTGTILQPGALRIGTDASASMALTGTVDEVAYYRTALPAEDVAAHTDAAAVPPVLLAATLSATSTFTAKVPPYYTLLGPVILAAGSDGGVVFGTPPSNDHRGDATPVTLIGPGDTYVSVPVPARHATTDTDEPDTAGSSNRSCWWRYTPAVDGVLTIDTGDSYVTDDPGSGYADTQIAVYTREG